MGVVLAPWRRVNRDEIWESKQAHADSLSLPAVQDAIAKGQPIIAGFASRVETKPVGGVGLG